MGTGDLLALMQQFDPQKKQQEQLALQSLQQQLALGRAAEERAQATHAAAQQRATQLDPLNLQLQQALANRIPAQDEAAQAAAAAARLGQQEAEFKFGQTQTNAPVISAGYQADLSAKLGAGALQQGQMEQERERTRLLGEHYAQQKANEEERNKIGRFGTAADLAFRNPGAAVFDPNELATQSGGLLRAPGTQAALNQLLASDPAGAQAYRAAHPEVPITPEAAAILAKHVTASTQAPGGTSTVPGAGAPGGLSDHDRNMQLFDLQNLEETMSPQALQRPVIGPLGPLMYGANYAGSRIQDAGRGVFDWLRQQQTGFGENIRKQREALQRK